MKMIPLSLLLGGAVAKALRNLLNLARNSLEWTGEGKRGTDSAKKLPRHDRLMSSD